MTATTPAAPQAAAPTDRELLEWAAKAAGMNVLQVPWPNEDGWFFCLRHEKPAMHFRTLGSHSFAPPWMPQDDDGDSFRLAAKVGLRVDFNYKTGADEKSGVGVWLPNDNCAYPTFWTATPPDIAKAARGAILRAAAHLGKVMP